MMNDRALRYFLAVVRAGSIRAAAEALNVAASAVSRQVADQDFRLNVRLETGSIELQRRFVQARMGVAYLPAFAAAVELKAKQVVAVPLADALLSQATTHLLVRAGRRLPEAVERIASRLAEGLSAFHAV
ncbi:LysR substrate-binding domain-containing protein [Neoroseomonas soli]|uniref:LysR family transcriptional regulator n=1 Tax=Neoroseomonas soli TaxID=1081025 RepID=A0A9X9WTJ3_9PROT|nr:LysR substrate-binding domain-containing protein [Neoroseomonas soli]MBR0670472.1 LysR family transcriptional regulator [Neoroseomonas soli]